MDAILDELNNAQYQAVSSKAKHLLVLAGAGSGKTRVLVHRIAWLMSQGHVSAQRILAVTFTNKAAQEMRNRIEKMIGVPTSHLWVGTFHGLCHRMLRQHYQEANLPNNFQIIDADDQLRLIKRLIRERGWDEQDCDPKRAVGFINRQKDEGKRATQVIPSTIHEITLFTELYRLYEQHCQRFAIIDFAEILLRAYELWRDNRDILAHYQQRFSHVLVDEFQDTNTIQYAWLKLIFSPETNMMIVGDDDQSIYGWRGAKIENIHRLNKDFKDIVTIRLEQNYRSTSTILAAANALIAHNESRLGKELWTQGIQGERITLYGAFNEIDEARFMVERIRQWIRGGGNYEDVAVLYRSNAQSRVIEQALRQMNMPYRIYGGLRFFDRAEIKDVLAYLRMLANHNDDTAFERVVNLPPRGIGERTLENIRELAKAQQSSLWEAAKAYLPSLPSGRISNGLRQFIECIEELLTQLAYLDLGQLVQTTLQRSGLLQYVKTKPGERTQAQVENLHELVQATKQFHQSYEEQETQEQVYAIQSLPDFLSEVALDAGEREQDQEATIKLMTLHSAKGLEFPLVFLSGLEEGLFPHHRSLQERTLLEEERRLCYVGVTRAMRKLYLTYAQKRAFAGLSGMNRPSRFIEEIPGSLLETANLNTKVETASTVSMSKIPSKDFPFALGQRVRHQRFGEGVIVNGDGQGETARVQVNFVHEGKKWLVLTYAKLEVVDN
ncbi:DNA helicase II [Candidatus Berkiella aquae]|uniref:DNA 3'-5' helicase n=1 Tax=Candidatus Berkiella aquae TaxID=295108 RepID=A0A0Q9YWZ8_9GAMM|nr:DNA helicase II [Candidatus Berkiella aquae]MCS5712739.1 DNA helicase II [Candidatus Berkiella aquae]